MNTDLSLVQGGLWEKLCSEEHLNRAWTKVAERGGKQGVDGVGVEHFASRLIYNLEQLLTELKNNSYYPLPVLSFSFMRGNKQRKVGIFTIRDRVVQNAVLLLLQPIWEKIFLNCSFAYRPGRSVFQAVAKVTEYIKAGYCYVLRADVDSFFESINHDILMSFIQKQLNECNLLILLSRILKVNIFSNGRMEQNNKGVVLGGTISPFLSNVYLHPLDSVMVGTGVNYLRFSDDIIVLSNSEDSLTASLEKINQFLNKLGLCLKPDKTIRTTLSKGFDFLGYRWSEFGCEPAHSPEKFLEKRIHYYNAWGYGEGSIANSLFSNNVCWEKLYGRCSIMGDIEDGFALAGLIKRSLEEGDKLFVEQLAARRFFLHVSLQELAEELALLWIQGGIQEMVLYEAAEQITGGNHAASKAILLQLLNDDLQCGQLCSLMKDLSLKDSSSWRDLSALCIEGRIFRAGKYADLVAARLEYGIPELDFNSHQGRVINHSVIDKDALSHDVSEPTEHNRNRLPHPIRPPGDLPGPELTDEEKQLFLELFTGREGVYARECLTFDGRRIYLPEEQHLVQDILQHHLAGLETIGIYLLRKNNTVKVLVIDIDISREIFLDIKSNHDELDRLLEVAHQDALNIQHIASSAGIISYIEDSGQRGRHVWIFFEDAVHAADARSMAKAILAKAGDPEPPLRREIFPDTERVREESKGPLIKLPLGKHGKTGLWALFLDETGQPFPDQGKFLRSIQTMSRKNFIQALKHLSDGPAGTGDISRKQLVLEPIDNELLSGMLPQIRSILEGCGLIHYLVKKAENAGYLSHYERLTLLCVFAHLGVEGKDFIHVVMQKCINYSQSITERFIKRLLPNPISCARIRERYPDITASIGCDCRFRTPAGSYPSPLLHAMGQSTGSAGGASRHSAIYQANQLAKNLMDLRRQQREVVRKIKACQVELEKIFDMLNIVEMETDIGTLKRYLAGDKYQWKLEL